MPETRLQTAAGRFVLRNPIICGSGEHVMTEQGIRAALSTGVAGVVAKSINESADAAQQLTRADYAILQPNGARAAAGPTTGPGALEQSLFCRSGLAECRPAEWFRMLATLDREAASRGQFVAASLVLADPAASAALAHEAGTCGIRLLELNIGAPHASEAAPAMIASETEPARIDSIVARVRSHFEGELWVKLAGITTSPAAAAAAARRAGANAVVLAGRVMAFWPDIDSLEPTLGTHAAYGGRWALPITCRSLALARRALGASLPLIGTNGARSGADVVRLLLAGASAVEMASVVYLAGFAALARAREELLEWLEQRDFTAQQIIGRSADALQTYSAQAERPGRWRDFVPPEAW